MDNTGSQNLGSDKENLKTIRITSFNVRGLKNNIKRHRVLNFLGAKFPGILFLQETFTTQGDKQLWEKTFKGEIIMSHGTNHSKGVAILIPDYLDIKIEETKIDTEGRYIFMDVKINGKRLCLLNCYAPTNTNSKEQLKYIDTILPIITEYHENLILAGDLNVHLDPNMDKKGGKINMATPYAGRLLEIFQEYNLVDLWRIMNPDTRRYTWRENTAYGII